MEELIAAIIAAAISIVGALAGFIVNRIKINTALNSTNGKLYFVTCPKCGNKIYLNSTTIQSDEE